jgi:hypothetical protein
MSPVDPGIVVDLDGTRNHPRCAERAESGELPEPNESTVAGPFQLLGAA